jgi:DNA-binding transcriptional regulator LsrR (DeoR family)
MPRQDPNRSRQDSSAPSPERRQTGGLEPPELLATVCQYFCGRGMKPTTIKQVLEAEHGVVISREEVYRLIRVAAAKGWIQFHPEPRYRLERALKARAPWLQDVAVVATSVYDGVSQRGAEMLLELLQQHYPGAEVVHIGFSGGTALRALARRFAELLRLPALHLPKRICFHALVAGFDVEEPTTDPNGFFTYFVEDVAMEVETSFVALYSPAIADDEAQDQLRRLSGFEDSHARARDIDVIVTSTTSWADDHSVLRHHMEKAGDSAERLERAGCVGDLLWQPIGPDGPLRVKTQMRAMTILELDEVSQRVEERKHVLLVAGPCARCHRPKSDVVDAILGQERRLITHLVLDSPCARAMLAGQPTGGALA